ncbi:ABC transporter permease subunit [Crocosphaera sp. UHCC 0190]|uniref:amino acid ABC transporter permease n=1 Tax=Crocosphaera sp. UHCC 0190 TaxID=3110246 RepID=UPI002B20D2B5|nr:ABC transporter permease subunit [Crocosphaera sp. UHCC 0190]MEA5512065.1 ABC transporter permease subunit [Crocosphaera sp. UHCC 0190]
MMNPEKIPLWRNAKFINIFLQGILIIFLVLLLAILTNNLSNNFQQLGLTFGFNFILDPDLNSRFDIGDSPIPYQATDPYSRALLVGLLNSLRVMISGIILAFILGVIIGLGRLSNNWLIRKISTFYVEIIRNTPLLLQLFFWYSVVFLKLPKIDKPLIFFDSVFLSNQGLYLPWPMGNLQTFLAALFLIIIPIFGVIIWKKNDQNIIQQGINNKLYLILLIILIILVIFLIIWGLDWQIPQYERQLKTIQGGLTLSPEFATLLVGLTVYTAAFIAEVIRAGIQSVSQGQWEAAKSLGLSSGLIMRFVIFPQALRVIIPPLTSEFLNLAKNSSLGSAVAYRDIYAVASTISNQTGKSLEMLLIVMITYLTINLIISTGMNWLNRLVQIKEN